MTTITTNSSPTELEKWFENWLKTQKMAGFICEKPAENLLTTFYAEKVVAGEIKASRKNVLACKRHLRDLERAGTDEFPYVFDIEKGHRPIRFIEKFCKPSKGDYANLTLQPWQHFVIGSLYGWVHRDTGLRRFREGLVFIGRKNGKTTMISGLANFAISKDNEPGARVYVLANSKQQAGELFDESRAMVQKSPALRRNMKENQKGIFDMKSLSRIEPRASDSKKLDGLNTHLGIFDEIHEFQGFKLINVIKRSWSARRQPMVIYITTAGYVLDGPLVEYYEVASDVLEGSNEQDRKFYFIAELDDEKEIDQPTEWIKANPNMGVTMKLPTMVQDYRSDRDIPQERNDWITKQFNMFVDNGEQSFVDFEVIKRNNKYHNIEELRGMRCIGGFDLSQTEDFTSACLEFILPDNRVFVLSHSWVPASKVEKDNEKIPYREWQDDGYLTIIPGEYVEYEYVYDWFVEMSRKYQIDKITFDPANAMRLVHDLQNYGFQTEVVRQGYITLSDPLKHIKELLLDGNVVYNENKLFTWYLNNVKLVEDRNGNWLPTKQTRYRKIDGFAAFLNAHTQVYLDMTKPVEGGSVGFISISDLLNG
ncbi:terminase large subunit [Bacillus licheniformis]|nr:terminase large subunit [Bacillus licheniformis]MDQ9094307.1 terminase large subunit [Bacillus licheniformis]MEC0478150.1 terminase large subunit [Bacillus licheniformis]MEC0490048.1 terminase large subunit [Bacillus licheniformis]